MIHVAALATLLHHATGRRDMILGTYASLRHWPELDSLIGLFVNFVPLRIKVDPARTFRELLDDIRTTILVTFEHADLAFETVKHALRRSWSRGPAIEVIATHAPERRASLTLPGLEVAPLGRPPGRFPWGLTVELADEGTLSGVFDPRRYAPAGCAGSSRSSPSCSSERRPVRASGWPTLPPARRRGTSGPRGWPGSSGPGAADSPLGRRRHARPLASGR